MGTPNVPELIDLIDSQEELLNQSSLERKEPPIIQLMDSSKKRRRRTTSVDGQCGSDMVHSKEFLELTNRISKLEECVQQQNNRNESVNSLHVTRQEFDNAMERILRLEHRVTNIETVLNGIKNIFGQKNGRRVSCPLPEKQPQNNTPKNSVTVHNNRSLHNKSLTPRNKNNWKSNSKATVQKSPATGNQCTAANGIPNYIPASSISYRQVLPSSTIQSPKRMDIPGTSEPGEEDEIGDEADTLPLPPRIPIKQELLDNAQFSIEATPTGNFRLNSEGDIIVFICGMARKIRNQDQYAAAYCWSVSDETVNRRHYISELKTNHIKLQAEILAGVMALNFIKVRCGNGRKIKIFARWQKLVEVMTKASLYPLQDTCKCTFFPCTHSLNRWVTSDSFAKSYPDDLPRLILAQKGLEVEWVSNGTSSQPEVASFLSFIRLNLKTSFKM